MPSEVFGCSTDRDGRFEYLKTDLGPFTNRFQLDTTGDQSLGKVSTTCAQRVGSDRHGSRGFVGFKECQSFVDGEESHQLVDEKVIVSEVGGDIVFKLEQVVGSGSTIV